MESYVPRRLPSAPERESSSLFECAEMWSTSGRKRPSCSGTSSTFRSGKIWKITGSEEVLQKRSWSSVISRVRLRSASESGLEAKKSTFIRPPGAILPEINSQVNSELDSYRSRCIPFTLVSTNDFKRDPQFEEPRYTRSYEFGPLVVSLVKAM
jgi:hypothetical protein